MNIIYMGVDGDLPTENGKLPLTMVSSSSNPYNNYGTLITLKGKK